VTTTAAARTGQDARRKPYKPRSVEEAVVDVLLRVGAAVALVGLAIVLLPVWGAALMVAYAYRLVARRVTFGWEWLPVVVVIAMATVGIIASWRIGLDPAGFLDVQRAAGGAFWAGATLPTGMPPDLLTGLLRDYAGAVWPYAAAWGMVLGGPALVGLNALVRFGSGPIPGEEEVRSELKIRDAATLKDQPVVWGVPNVIGRNVISLLSAPPGGGKGWWLWAMLRAMQDGRSFFGLPAHRMRVLWCTEEGTSFARTRERFGVNKGMVEVLHRHEVRGWDWPDLVRQVRREAWRRKCAIVVFDTVRAWCPQAEKSPEEANAVMGVVRQELTGPGLGALFVHHDTKAGGKFGAGVSGTYGLVGAVDVLIELHRVSDDPDDARRQMTTSRRFDPLDVTATLEGVRYLVAPVRSQGESGSNGEGHRPARDAVREAIQRGDLAPANEHTCARCEAPAAEWHHTSYAPGDELAVTPLCKSCHMGETTDTGATLRSTVAAIDAGGGSMTTEAFMAALKIGKAAASARLNAAEAAGLVERSGRGGRSGPQVWRIRSGPGPDGPGPDQPQL
jgi:hypothetical protein